MGTVDRIKQILEEKKKLQTQYIEEYGLDPSVAHIKAWEDVFYNSLTKF